MRRAKRKRSKGVPMMSMLAFIQDSFIELMRRGGWVMWPLLVLSLVKKK